MVIVATMVTTVVLSFAIVLEENIVKGILAAAVLSKYNTGAGFVNSKNALPTLPRPSFLLCSWLACFSCSAGA